METTEERLKQAQKISQDAYEANDPVLIAKYSASANFSLMSALILEVADLKNEIQQLRKERNL